MSKAGKIKWANKREKLWTGSGERVQAASGIMPRFIPRCAVAASLGVSGAAGFLPYPSVHAPLGIVCSAQSGRLCSAIFPARASATLSSPARGAMHMRMSGRGRTTPSDDSIGPTTEEEKLQQGYETTATVWLLAGALHLLSFSLLNPASWTTRAMFSLAYSHFLLWLLTIRALTVGISRRWHQLQTYQQLNVALALSAMLTFLVTVFKFLLKGVVEVAVPATALVASVATLLVSARVWYCSIRSTHHLRSPNPELSPTDQAVMAAFEGFVISIKELLAPKRIDGVVYRVVAVRPFPNPSSVCLNTSGDCALSTHRTCLLRIASTKLIHVC